jgi:YfiH family protein
VSLLTPFRGLEGIPYLAQGVTSRLGGVSTGAFATLNLGLGTEDDPAAVHENRRRVAAALGAARLVLPHQVHGRDLRRVACASGRVEDPGQCDGLSTGEPGLALGVLGADCPSVLLVDAGARALAVVHAGWRGVATGIVAAALEHLYTEYGSAAEDLRVGIGPGISCARYEVSADVAEQIGAALPIAARGRVLQSGRPGHAQADLVLAIRIQLESAGVPSASIETSDACTYDDERFYSHRQDRGRTGRHALVAAWREGAG